MRFWLVAVMLLSTSVGDMRGQSSSTETDAAPQQFRWAVKNQSKIFIEQLNLATEDIESHRYDAALQRFQKLVELNPELAQLWQQIGRLQYELKDFKSAANAFSRASKISPDLGYAQLKLKRLSGSDLFTTQSVSVMQHDRLSSARLN